MSDNIPVPTVELLVKELKEVTDWILFGVSLGVPVRILDTIKLGNPHEGVENWKMKMFHFWLRLKSDASWKDVVQALELNDYGFLAARVKRTYILGKNAEEEEDEEFETEVHADANVVRQLHDLETSFGLMLSRFGSIVKDCDNELSEARTFLNRVCGSREFSDCKNIDELLDQLCRDHIDPFNLYRLNSLLEIFESKKEALDKVIEKYEEKKETFLKSTTVSQFQRGIVEKVEPMLQKGKVLVTIKILKKMKCAQLTLKDIENLALEGFEDSQQYLVRMHAKSGSVIISWVLPEDHSCELEKSVRKNAAVFKKRGVEEVTIGGKIVFPLEEDIALKEVYTDFYHRLVEAVSDEHTCQSLLTQFSSSALISEEKIARLSSSKGTGSSFLNTLGLEEEAHLLVPLVNAMSRVEQIQTLAEKMTTAMKPKQGKQQQQLEADNERLTSDNANLLTRLQCCEKELKEVTELSIMREKVVSSMMAASQRDQFESTMSVAKKVSESNQGQQQQQLEADIERLSSENADLLTRLQSYEELKEVTELSIMREKAVSGMTAGRERDQSESAMAVAKNVSESNQDSTTTYTQLVQRAMREGRTKVQIIKALIVGPPGVGKTGIRHLLLGLPPPPSRTSTPLATRATRAISLYRIKADGSGDVPWTELDDDTYLKYIAEEVKMIEPTSTTLAITESSAQEPHDVDHTSLVLSPATPLDSSLSPVSLKVKGIVSDIVNMLVTNPNILEEKRTLGQKSTFVHLIDSGGQPSFISLIPAFVRGSTVSIVASKVNHSINDRLQYNYVKDYQHLRQPMQLEKSQLEVIEEVIRTTSSVMHSEEGSDQGPSEPKFLLIGTHADKHWSLFQESLSKKNKLLKERLGELKSMCIEASRDGDILLAINTRVIEGRNEVASSIRQKIIDACGDAEVDIPIRWYVFELEVSSKAKKEGRSVLGLTECIEVGGNLGMREEDVMAALVFLDRVALCLYFKAAAPHLVFTDPQAILSEITEILNLGIIDLHLIPSHYPGIDKLRDQGLFNKILVDILCSKYRVNEEGKCSYSADDFLSILQHLLIIAPVCIDGKELFFIPSILPTFKILPLPGLELAPLVLLCRTRIIPLGMFSALVVALLNDKLLHLDKILGRNSVSLKCKVGGGLVQLVECHAWLTVHFNGHPSVAPRIRAAIHRAIATACRRRHLDTKQIVFTDGFFCPFKICESMPHACVVDTTFSPARLTCSVRPNVGCGPCSDERMLAWLAAPDASTVSASSSTATLQSPPPTVSVSASATAQSPSITLSSPPTGTDTVSRFQFMEIVASKIPAKWKRVGVSLGIEQNDLDAINMHRLGDPLECFSDVFTYWQQQSTPQSPANWATLVTVLRSNYVGEEALSDTIQNTFM